MSAQTDPVDVLAVLRQMQANSSHFRNGLPALADHHDGEFEREQAALAVVAEVLAADREYDDAMRAAHSAPEFSIREQQQAMTRLVAARARRKRALQLVQVGAA